ncbi:hypothetical protein Prum_003760 [Phytohabitans rumicis]|uniref:Uncharacterized protein n=1 Tax=Phytohabitans rumicis TaxID=1076125 RepID=A0A6V8KSB0_9ACTN|nr:hypothetical protein Prum_003760 [Phytohabitans rumicis]
MAFTTVTSAPDVFISVPNTADIPDWAVFTHTSLTTSACPATVDEADGVAPAEGSASSPHAASNNTAATSTEPKPNLMNSALQINFGQPCSRRRNPESSRQPSRATVAR